MNESGADSGQKKQPYPPKPPKPPQTPGSTGSMQTLFEGSGPVTLGSAHKSTTMLGNLQAPKPYERMPVAPPAEAPPPMPETPPAQEEKIASYTEPIATYDEPIATAQDESRRIAFKTFADTPSPATSWSPKRWKPRIDSTAFVHPLGVLIGNVRVDSMVFIAAGAVIRGDNEEPIYIGTDSSIQESAVLKDLPTHSEGKLIDQRIVDVDNTKYSLYIADRVTVGSQAQVHGPAYIGNDVYIGMQSLVFWARVEAGVIIEPGCLVMNVTIPSGVFVPAGLKLTNQKAVKDLPPLTSRYRFHGINEEMVAAHREILRGYHP
jgi:carbonic anhydrase/acetyltransferase-like protein (isoleucine patch superfamily)